MQRQIDSEAQGKLAVLLPGLGAVSTTFIAGIELIRRGEFRPVGSLTQLGRMNLRTGEVPIASAVPLAPLDQLCFGAWDIVNEDAATVAARSGVLSREHMERVGSFLGEIRPRRGVHRPDLVRRIEANHTKQAQSHRQSIEELREDIRDFKRTLGADRAVMIYCGSTEAYRPPAATQNSLAALERGLDQSDPSITPTLLYAYAAIMENVPFANGTPNRSVETLALQELATERAVPIAGRDFKTGQTLMKTVIAPALKARMLGLRGWFSTNILGNRDGEVLDDPENFRSKELTKSGVLDTILPAETYPELYGNIDHKVSIHYYPPRGDEKEGWDNIDLFGWLDYPMQIKVNFLCRDSILAAPLVLDLALLMDLASRTQRGGIQDWLSFFFKSPISRTGSDPEHDLFTQARRLEDTLRLIAERVARVPAEV